VIYNRLFATTDRADATDIPSDKQGKQTKKCESIWPILAIKPNHEQINQFVVGLSIAVMTNQR